MKLELWMASKFIQFVFFLNPDIRERLGCVVQVTCSTQVSRSLCGGEVARSERLSVEDAAVGTYTRDG